MQCYVTGVCTLNMHLKSCCFSCVVGTFKIAAKAQD
jgi:hypothetical protein